MVSEILLYVSIRQLYCIRYIINISVFHGLNNTHIEVMQMKVK